MKTIRHTLSVVHAALLRSCIGFACALAINAAACAQNIPWTPMIVSWYCNAQADATLSCTLSAFGEEPPNTSNLVPQGWARVRKGRTYGEGPFLSAVPFTMSCVHTPPYMSCEARDIVKLGLGITPVISYTSLIPDINIYSDTPTRLFDWNGDGMITAEQEGLALSRYLMGFKGSALIDNLNLFAGATSGSVAADVAKGAWLGWFSFTDPMAYPKALTDAVIFSRCARGMRGPPLTAGLTIRDSASVTAQCESIMRLE